jgi:hypothetical protein
MAPESEAGRRKCDEITSDGAVYKSVGKDVVGGVKETERVYVCVLRQSIWPVLFRNAVVEQDYLALKQRAQLPFYPPCLAVELLSC